MKRGLLEACVLSALAREDSYGYKIVKDLSVCVQVSESTLYPILRRLENAGALTVYSGEHNSRLRKFYHLTEQGRQQLADAVKVLIEGDGNDNAATQFTIGTSPISGVRGTLGYDQLVEFWGQFDPYTMNTILCSTGTMTKLLKVPELQNPLTGLNFQGTGTLTTPLGAKLLRTSALPAGTLIGLDKNYALEQICGSEITVEYDKLIDRQLERAAITSISGFAKLFGDASKVLKV